jgi:hypothetical protein
MNVKNEVVFLESFAVRFIRAEGALESFVRLGLSQYLQEQCKAAIS